MHRKIAEKSKSQKVVTHTQPQVRLRSRGRYAVARLHAHAPALRVRHPHHLLRLDGHHLLPLVNLQLLQPGQEPAHHRPVGRVAVLHLLARELHEGGVVHHLELRHAHHHRVHRVALDKYGRFHA